MKDDVINKMFAAVIVPFKPRRLALRSEQSNGTLCTCPKCAVDWVLSLLVDMHEFEGDDPHGKKVLFATIHAAAVFWTHGIRLTEGITPEQRRAEFHKLIDQALDAAETPDETAYHNPAPSAPRLH